MRAPFASLTALLLFGCREQAPAITDDVLEQIVSENPGMTAECIEAIRTDGLQAMPIATDQCYEMEPQRRWVGLWQNWFEGEQFCPAPASRCEIDSTPLILLGGSENSLPIESLQSDGLYEIEFLGRKTKKPGAYGHLGMFEHEIIVDQLISIRRVD